MNKTVEKRPKSELSVAPRKRLHLLAHSEQPWLRLESGEMIYTIILLTALIGSNLIVYQISLLGEVDPFQPSNSRLLDFGAINTMLVFQGQIWRLFTSLFVHVDYSHLTNNMVALGIFGFAISRYLTWYQFSLIYFLGGISGSVMSIVMGPPERLVAGASGAVFATFGAGLAMELRGYPVFGKFKRFGFLGNFWVMFIAFQIIDCIGFGRTGIGYFSHLGGLLLGSTYVFLLGSRFFNNRQKKLKQSLEVGFCLMLIFYSLAVLKKTVYSNSDIAKAAGFSMPLNIIAIDVANLYKRQKKWEEDLRSGDSNASVIHYRAQNKLIPTYKNFKAKLENLRAEEFSVAEAKKFQELSSLLPLLIERAEKL